MLPYALAFRQANGTYLNVHAEPKAACCAAVAGETGSDRPASRRLSNLEYPSTWFTDYVEHLRAWG